MYTSLVLLLLCAHWRPASSFVQLRTVHIFRRHGPNIISQPTTSISASTLSSSTTSNPKQSTRETSNELLRILQRKAAANSNSQAKLDERINSLVQTLIASKTQFNPAKCIDGPLFASVHFIGDTPLWEKIGSGAVRNVKGQKYALNGKGAGTFVNYAEIIGENFFLKAVGGCKALGPVSLLPSSSVAEKNPSDNPFIGALTSLFDSSSNNDMLPTPYDYAATVTGASIVLLKKFSLDLSIEGTGTVRVLYADEKLRIFVSPKDTNVTKGAGDWESEGLIVVQVRVDLVYDDWDDRL